MFKGIDQIIEPAGKSSGALKSTTDNPDLTGSTTRVYWTSVKICIGDFWVSKDVVSEGIDPDSLTWVRLKATTNQERKLISDYIFDEVELEAGEYKSVKMTFKNTFYRYVQLVSDPSLNYEIFETMGSWTDECDVNDETFVEPQYFGQDNSYRTNSEGLLVYEDETTIAPFRIDAGKQTLLNWQFGGSATDCILQLIDEDNNLRWDCGIDRINDDECAWEYMFSFGVEYE
ncbi:MAG: hypothetical protein PF694_05180 [Bacteroidetes bacterium]|nr:hypothetical protein [Bacteroidota bacterium]